MASLLENFEILLANKHQQLCDEYCKYSEECREYHENFDYENPDKNPLFEECPIFKI